MATLIVIINLHPVIDGSRCSPACLFSNERLKVVDLDGKGAGEELRDVEGGGNQNLLSFKKKKQINYIILKYFYK